MTSRSPSALELVDEIAKLVRSHYVFPATADEVAAQLQAWADQGRYSDCDQEAISQTFTDDLRSLTGDQHFRVLPRPLTEAEASAAPEDRWKSSMPGADANFGFRHVGVADGAGVLEVTSLSPGAEAAATANAAMAFLRHARSLIIDLRACPGGDPDLIMLLASYLAGEERIEMASTTWRHTGKTDRHWTDPGLAAFRFPPSVPVYVVIGPRTASGAEALAYCLQAVGRAVVVGQPSLGAAHRITQFEIGGSLLLTIPTGKVTNPVTGGDWEGTGVVPSVVVDDEQDPVAKAIELGRDAVASDAGAPP